MLLLQGMDERVCFPTKCKNRLLRTRFVWRQSEGRTLPVYFLPKRHGHVRKKHCKYILYRQVLLISPFLLTCLLTFLFTVTFILPKFTCQQGDETLAVLFSRALQWQQLLPMFPHCLYYTGYRTLWIYTSCSLLAVKKTYLITTVPIYHPRIAARIPSFRILIFFLSNRRKPSSGWGELSKRQVFHD